MKCIGLNTELCETQQSSTSLLDLSLIRNLLHFNDFKKNLRPRIP